MIDLTLEMVQYDCPFVAATDDHDVSFSTYQWEFDPRNRELETRMVVEGDNRAVLDAGLSAIRNHHNMCEFHLFKKREEQALIRTSIRETDAMATIRDNDGYVTGPFYAADGSERWEIGFDDEAHADAALAELERNNEYTVESRKPIAFDAPRDALENAEAAHELLEGCRSLSDVERETLRVAAQKGYFDQPRGATLQMLANEFDVSDTAVSKNVRRAERKILRRVVEALESVE